MLMVLGANKGFNFKHKVYNTLIIIDDPISQSVFGLMEICVKLETKDNLNY